MVIEPVHSGSSSTLKMRFLGHSVYIYISTPGHHMGNILAHKKLLKDFFVEKFKTAATSWGPLV